MTLPNFSIALPPTRINFATDVGLTGTVIDNYPAPGQQARYDWFRSVVIGLLAQQASFSPPTIKAVGAAWFDLNTFTLKIWNETAWVPYAQVIALTDPDSNGHVITLANWYQSTQSILNNLAAEVSFSGHCTANGITSISIPVSLQSNLFSDSRVFLYINGSLIDPHNCNLIGSPLSTIKLSSIALSSGDTFIVVIKRMSASTFLPNLVTVP